MSQWMTIPPARLRQRVVSATRLWASLAKQESPQAVGMVRHTPVRSLVQPQAVAVGVVQQPQVQQPLGQQPLGPCSPGRSSRVCRRRNRRHRLDLLNCHSTDNTALKFTHIFSDWNNWLVTWGYSDSGTTVASA